MLERLHSSLKILAKQQPASSSDMAAMEEYFGSVPQEYAALMAEASEIEFQRGAKYFRIWHPSGCIDMDQGYHIRECIAGCIPVGDDGGGDVIFYDEGEQGFGVYLSDYSVLDRQEAVFIAESLSAILLEGKWASTASEI